MAPLQGPPLVKITLNLYEEDVEWLKREYGQGWSARLRDTIHHWKITRCPTNPTQSMK